MHLVAIRHWLLVNGNRNEVGLKIEIYMVKEVVTNGSSHKRYASVANGRKQS
jgi:hypothetical protein